MLVPLSPSGGVKGGQMTADSGTDVIYNTQCKPNQLSAQDH